MYLNFNCHLVKPGFIFLTVLFDTKIQSVCRRSQHPVYSLGKFIKRSVTLSENCFTVLETSPSLCLPYK